MLQATVEAPACQEACLPPQWPVLYGPVQSRRLGFSLGVNLLPKEDKACNFDCLYCECGWTPWMAPQKSWFRSLDAVREALDQDLPVFARQHPSIDTITVSGHGEPTLFPEFPEAVQLVRESVCEHLPWARLAILTNGTTLWQKATFEAVSQFDLKCVKLDAGAAWMNRPHAGIDIAALLPVWGQLPNLTLQSFFSEGPFDNTRWEWVEPWIEQVRLASPRCVQLYTLDRLPAAQGMQKASLSTLNRIGRRLASETNCHVQIFD